MRLDTVWNSGNLSAVNDVKYNGTYVKGCSFLDISYFVSYLFHPVAFLPLKNPEDVKGEHSAKKRSPLRRAQGRNPGRRAFEFYFMPLPGLFGQNRPNCTKLTSFLFVLYKFYAGYLDNMVLMVKNLTKIQ